MGFSKDFLFGAATASYQIEGGRGANGMTPSIWDVFSHQKGNVKLGHTGDMACDHFHRYPEDVSLMKAIGLEAYRFSAAWSRVIGEDGTVNEKGLDFYDRLVDELLKHGIEPFLTLYHWDLPYWLYEKGGWGRRDIAQDFAVYTEAVTKRLSDRVTRWMTFNEPQCFIGLGLETGVHAPFLKRPRKEVLQAAHNVMLSHGLSVQTLRAHAKQTPQVGFAPTGSGVIPATDSPYDVEAARQVMFSTAHDLITFTSAWWSDPMILGAYPQDGWAFYQDDMPEVREGDMKQICQPLDFYGVNIYQAERIVRLGETGQPEFVELPPGFPRTAMGWPVLPQSLYWMPKFLYERYKLPIYITENGLAVEDWVMEDGQVHDPQRIDFLSRYLSELERAHDSGVKIDGYFLWSLLDNFEWAEGYEKRFGIIHVDYETQKRTLKDSALWYRDYIAAKKKG